MHTFVSGLNVDVLSLFVTKPRQSRRFVKSLRSDDESDGNSTTTAFRLCINSEHCDRLFVESKWPAYVSVSEWFFKPSGQAIQPQDKHTNTASNSAAVDGGATYVIGVDVLMVDNADGEGDETLFVSDHSQGTY